MIEPVDVTGIMLRGDGPDIVVEVERGGRWYEVIRELAANTDTISHVVEPAGILGAPPSRLGAVTNPSRTDPVREADALVEEIERATARVLRRAGAGAWPCGECGQPGPLPCCGGCYCTCGCNRAVDTNI